ATDTSASTTTTSTTTTGADTGETSITTTIITTTTTSTPSEILNSIPNKFKNPPYPLYVFQNTTECDNTTGKFRIPMDFEFDNNATTLNDLINTMEDLTERVGVELFIKDLCGRDTEEVKNVTSCYVINACGLCGTNPVRGVCYPEFNEPKCKCFASGNDTTGPYEGNFCYSSSSKPLQSTNSPSRWTPIIVGVLAGLTALFCAITCCLWAIAIWRRRKRHPKEDELRIRRIWHLPRAVVPAPVTTENPQPYLGTPPPGSNRADSIHTDSNTI
ncbi:unnamed protein product, partial [Adineta steineri]